MGQHLSKKELARQPTRASIGVSSFNWNGKVTMQGYARVAGVLSNSYSSNLRLGRFNRNYETSCLDSVRTLAACNFMRPTSCSDIDGLEPVWTDPGVVNRQDLAPCALNTFGSCFMAWTRRSPISKGSTRSSGAKYILPIGACYTNT